MTLSIDEIGHNAAKKIAPITNDNTIDDQIVIRRKLLDKK